MSYNITNTRNTVVDTVPNQTLRVTEFGIRIPGRDFVGYGEAIAQTFFHILENHAAPNNGSDEPVTSNPAVDLTNPVDGQLWYDLTNQVLRVYDSSDGRWNVASGAAAIQDTAPSTPSVGTLWYNSSPTVQQLLAYDGTNWRTVGPDHYGNNRFNNTGHNKPIIVYSGGSGGLTTGNGPAPTGGTPTDAMGTFVNNALVAVTIDTAVTGNYFYVELNDDSNTVQYYDWTGIDGNKSLLAGINLRDDDDGYRFNGRAKLADTALSLNGATATNFMRNDNGAGATASRVPTATGLNIGSTGSRWNTIFGTVFDGVATTARYADVAERYEADKPMSAGDVVSIGGTKEITLATLSKSKDVFGVISTNPALLMNNDAGNDETHPPVALTGRVPVKVTGTIKKGDRLVVSHIDGHARVEDELSTEREVIGRALEDKNDTDTGVIEAIIGVK